jgi:hypothetical protein
VLGKEYGGTVRLTFMLTDGKGRNASLRPFTDYAATITVEELVW